MKSLVDLPCIIMINHGVKKILYEMYVCISPFVNPSVVPNVVGVPKNNLVHTDAAPQVKDEKRPFCLGRSYPVV